MSKGQTLTPHSHNNPVRNLEHPQLSVLPVWESSVNDATICLILVFDATVFNFPTYYTISWHITQFPDILSKTPNVLISFSVPIVYLIWLVPIGLHHSQLLLACACVLYYCSQMCVLWITTFMYFRRSKTFKVDNVLTRESLNQYLHAQTQSLHISVHWRCRIWS